MRHVPQPVIEEIRKAARRSRARFFENDPVRFAHRYRRAEDREVVALVCALLAFGKVRAFSPKIERLLDVLGDSPRRYALEYDPEKDLDFFRAFKSRVYTGDALRLFFLHLRALLREHGTLEDAFLAGGGPAGDSQDSSHRIRLTAFTRLFYRLGPGGVTGTQDYPAGYRHLVCDPSRGGASKRWNLFLRWVVRPADGVDLGLWKRVSPSDLVIPLDIHVGRISFLIGLRRRRTPDWKAAEEITASLRSLDPDDPVRFDFPLSHIGISDHCRGRWAPHICGPCAISRICRIGKRHQPKGTLR